MISMTQYRRKGKGRLGGEGSKIGDDISLRYVGIKGNVFSVLSGYTIMNQTLRVIIEMDSTKDPL